VAVREGGLQVFDVSSPYHVRWVGGYEITTGGENSVAVSGLYAYVTDGFGLHILDVSDPSNPRRVSGYYAAGARDVLAVSGNYAYVAFSTGVLIIDVSDPAEPQWVSDNDTMGYAPDVSVSGNYAYVATRYSGLQVFDVSDPANPQRVGGNTAFSARGVVATEDYVFVTTDRGLVILHQFTPLIGPALSFGPVRAGQHGMELSLQGLPGLNVDIERSSDLQHWQSWTSGLLGTGPLELTDPEVNSWQFYRAKVR
jgi:hypothetical protein